jgi:hypothetical protein
VPTITDKRQMYAMLAAGELGNTIPQFFSVADWTAAGGPTRYPFWGVRTLTPGGPCRLNCPAGEVAATVAAFAPHPPNISPMVSCVGQVTLIADVWDSPLGVVVEGHEYPPRVHDWREMMKTRNRWEGVAARMVLRKHLNANSHGDLWELFEQFPGNVVELSALEVCFGTVPGRNAVVWEVRDY